MNEILDILTPLQANVTMDERHRYHIRTHDWIPVPSVTQVLDKLPKPFLVPWAGKMQRQVDIDAFWQIAQQGKTWYAREALEAAVLAITGKEYAASTIRDAAGNVGTRLRASRPARSRSATTTSSPTSARSRPRSWSRTAA